MNKMDDTVFLFGVLIGFLFGIMVGTFIGATAITMENNSIKNTQIEQKDLTENIEQKCSIESDDYIILNNEIYYKK